MPAPPLDHSPNSWNVRFSSRYVKYMVGEQLMLPPIDVTPGATCQTPTNSWGCGYGSGLIRTPLTTLKIAVFAPMPNAKVTNATVVNIGDHARRRKMWLSVFMGNNTVCVASEFLL